MSASNGSGRIHLLGQENKKNGKHNATLDEVHEIVVGVLGPLAQLLREVCIRQQAIEDHIGYVHPASDGASESGAVSENGRPRQTAETTNPGARDSIAPRVIDVGPGNDLSPEWPPKPDATPNGGDVE